MLKIVYRVNNNRGNKYLLVYFDCLLRYDELVLTTFKAAIEVAKALWVCIISRDSTPRVLISNNAKKFIGEVLIRFPEACNIKSVSTVAY